LVKWFGGFKGDKRLLQEMKKINVLPLVKYETYVKLIYTSQNLSVLAAQRGWVKHLHYWENRICIKGKYAQAATETVDTSGN
jgi:hypothetical protein